MMLRSVPPHRVIQEIDNKEAVNEGKGIITIYCLNAARQTQIEIIPPQYEQ